VNAEVGPLHTTYNSPAKELGKGSTFAFAQSLLGLGSANVKPFPCKQPINVTDPKYFDILHS